MLRYAVEARSGGAATVAFRSQTNMSGPDAHSTHGALRRLSITGDERDHAAVADLIRQCLQPCAPADDRVPIGDG
jgi:hypothetical protein